MFSPLYNTSIRLYAGLLRLLAPFNPKARQWVVGRQDWRTQLAQKLAGNTAPLVWFHAASLGEFEQGRPVIEAFRAQYPAYKILLTFFSPSGYEVRKNYAGADYILYLPADTPANARDFVRLVRPQLAFFIKYEFWANYLHELRAAGVPTLSFSAIFRPGQLFFRSWGVKPVQRFYREILTCFAHILVQNEESVRLLRQIDITDVTRAGDTRFDRVAQVAAARKVIPLAATFKAGQPLLVVGSAWQADMQVLIPFLNAFEQPLKVIVAPHEIHNDEIERWRAQLKRPSVRYSALLNQTADAADSAVQTLFIDNIGLLSSLYQYGEFAYIGGAFGKGLHNILEAATFGVPVFFGPNYRKFQEAVDLVAEGGAFTVADTVSLADAFARQYPNPAQAAQISRAYVERNIGATAKVMEVVATLMRKQANE
ncbi:3-deoxy-D-manno-octulosonic acid transferase [Rudanella paleaurantiibacter]|uniref:3-deoxy-D-manno-octulosonic acid transferase n=1 Tax=Rudanella paleaurantiibacter TaxID=2614655 RepID=A0A7J5TXF5_9BACT|nr:glycosyltransferase N-terminal domain-containing protein [Rudanella paleaurantiibacter]KAB7729261.1 3-deoxy-D-manno-octulosonic acid transferase [Rudanella paleaurantiibacter]